MYFDRSLPLFVLVTEDVVHQLLARKKAQVKITKGKRKTAMGHRARTWLTFPSHLSSAKGNLLQGVFRTSELPPHNLSGSRVKHFHSP